MKSNEFNSLLLFAVLFLSQLTVQETEPNILVQIPSEYTSIDQLEYKHTTLNSNQNKIELNYEAIGDNDEIKEESMATFIFMCIVYLISTLTAIISNFIVILVYVFVKRSKTELSVFLVNLAVADFLMSTVCMPFSFAQVIMNKWVFGEIMCPIVLFQQVLAVSLSIYTMVAIGIDRYYAIKSPLKNRATRHKAKLTILIVWILSIALASVQLFVARVQENTTQFVTFDNDTNSSSIVTSVSDKTCNENWSETDRKTYTIFNLFAVYLIPVAILGYTYTCIGYIVKHATHPGNSDTVRDLNYNKSKSKVVKMLIVLVCVFTLCWLPLHMFTILADFTDLFTHFNVSTISFWYYISHWLAMANCTMNPIIYGYSNKAFRSDVCSLFICTKFYRARGWHRHRSYKSSKGPHCIQNRSAVDIKKNFISIKSDGHMKLLKPITPNTKL